MKVSFFNLMTELSELTDSQLKELEDTYKSVGEELNKDSTISKYNAQIFAQGSVSLGTVVKPEGDDDYDIDEVCKLESGAIGLGPRIIKKMIGNRLKENQNLNYHLDSEGKRCWTLIYKKYHLDILPSVQDPFNNYLHATDKDANGNYSFTSTSPLEYRKWFLSIANKPNQILFEKRIVQKIPEFPKKTPLQKAVQLLKMHRNKEFMLNQEDKPISIIITTLCALSYEKGDNVLEALEEFVDKFKKYILLINGVDWIANPVLPSENFAEKWMKEPQKKASFEEWTNKFKADFNDLSSANEVDDFLKISSRMFNEKLVKETANQLWNISDKIDINKNRAELIPYICDFPFPCNSQAETLSLRLDVKDQNGRFLYTFHQGTNMLKKKMTILFYVENDILGERYWQVVNSGKEAFNQNDLRGSWFSDNRTPHEEKTQYKGRHFIRCAIMRRGEFVAISNWIEICIGEN